MQVTKQEIQDNLTKLVKQYVPSLQNEEITRETPINSRIAQLHIYRMHA